MGRGHPAFPRDLLVLSCLVPLLPALIRFLFLSRMLTVSRLCALCPRETYPVAPLSLGRILRFSGVTLPIRGWSQSGGCNKTSKWLPSGEKRPLKSQKKSSILEGGQQLRGYRIAYSLGNQRDSDAMSLPVIHFSGSQVQYKISTDKRQRWSPRNRIQDNVALRKWGHGDRFAIESFLKNYIPKIFIWLGWAFPQSHRK